MIIQKQTVRVMAIASLFMLNQSINCSSPWDKAKELAYQPARWIYSKLPDQSKSIEIAKLIARKPTTWVATGALGYAGYKLGNLLGNQKYGFGAVGSTFLLSHMSTFMKWFKLRNKFLELSQKQTGVSDPAIRNVWYNPLDKDGEAFEDGAHMITVFTATTNNGKNVIKQALIKQMGLQTDTQAMAAVDTALLTLSNELTTLSNFTNIQYILSSGSGFKTPHELITGDTLIKHSMGDDAALRAIYNESIEYSLYSIQWDWSTKFDLPCPAIYAWTYMMASRCVWIILKKYSFLKAIRRIMEHIISDESHGAQKHYVTLMPNTATTTTE